jgi:hypothetical protein
MPEQNPVSVQCTLGGAGRARGVNDQRRVIGTGRRGLETIRCGFQGRRPDQQAGFRPPSREVRADDHGQIRQPVADRLDLGEVLAVGDERPRAAMRQPLLQRVGAEQGEQRHRNRAHLVGRTCAMAVSGLCGSRMPIRSLRPDPCAAKALASRLERRMISRKVYSWIWPAASSQIRARLAGSPACRRTRRNRCCRIRRSATGTRCRRAHSCLPSTAGARRAVQHRTLDWPPECRRQPFLEE